MFARQPVFKMGKHEYTEHELEPLKKIAPEYWATFELRRADFILAMSSMTAPDIETNLERVYDTGTNEHLRQANAWTYVAWHYIFGPMPNVERLVVDMDTLVNMALEIPYVMMFVHAYLLQVVSEEVLTKLEGTEEYHEYLKYCLLAKIREKEQEKQAA